MIAALTVAAKLLGLARDLVITNYFGTSVYADAFNLAYIFTGSFFIMFGCIGGPFYNAIVAALPAARKLSAEEFRKYLFSMLGKLMLISAGIAIVLFFAKDPILSLMIDKSANQLYFDLTKMNFNWLLPLIVLTAPIGLLAGVLNAFKKYFAPSLAPAVVNIVLIAGVILTGDGFNGLALAIGTSLGALVSTWLQLPFLNCQDYEKYKLEIEEESKDAETKDDLDLSTKFRKILIPALLSTATIQLVIFTDSFFCKSLDQGSWTSLVLANRLVQMPLGVLQTAFLVPVFPEITKLVAAGKVSKMFDYLKKALIPVALLCIPASIVGYFFAEPIVAMIFERGAFDANSTIMVASAFMFISLAILPMVLRDTAMRVFYSFGDAKTPLYITLFALLLKIGFNYLFITKFAVAGLTLSTLVTSLISTAVMWVLIMIRCQKTEC